MGGEGEKDCVCKREEVGQTGRTAYQIFRPKEGTVCVCVSNQDLRERKEDSSGKKPLSSSKEQLSPSLVGS